MNRQLRRAQEKKDRQKERDKDRAKAARRSKVTRRRQRRRLVPRPDEPQTPQTRKRQPGRFASLFTAATGLFIVLQALVPVPEVERLGFSFLVEVLYYLLFGYFVVTWLMRLGRPRALLYGALSGVGLALVLQLVRLALPALGLDLLLLAAAIPAVLAGAWLGRLVYLRAP